MPSLGTQQPCHCAYPWRGKGLAFHPHHYMGHGGNVVRISEGMRDLSHAIFWFHGVAHQGLSWSWSQGVQHVKAAFYALRFLLGAAESGTMPGMWYHASLFYSGALAHPFTCS